MLKSVHTALLVYYNVCCSNLDGRTQLQARVNFLTVLVQAQVNEASITQRGYYASLVYILHNEHRMKEALLQMEAIGR